MILRAGLAAAAALGAAPAPQAAEAARIYVCLSTAADRRACVGEGAALCRTHPGNEAAAGELACLRAERDVWEATLAMLAGRLAQAAARADEADPAAGAQAAQHEAERSWRDWRRAECAARGAQLGGGLLGRVERADCEMRLTADRVFAARDLLDRR